MQLLGDSYLWLD